MTTLLQTALDDLRDTAHRDAFLELGARLNRDIDEDAAWNSWIDFLIGQVTRRAASWSGGAYTATNITEAVTQNAMRELLEDTSRVFHVRAKTIEHAKTVYAEWQEAVENGEETV